MREPQAHEKVYIGRRWGDPAAPGQTEVVVEGYGGHTRPLQLSARGRFHSPDGFEWGYGGSGPAALAHSILLDAVGSALADSHYMRFKAEVVALLPRSGWRLLQGGVRSWIATKEPSS